MKPESLVQIVVPGVPEQLEQRIKRIAKREGRSRAAQIRVLLEEIVASREAQLKQAA